MNQTEFGHELVKIRKAKGLTQSELAEKCNVSKRTIQRIEAGLVIPRSFTVKTLSDALDFDFLKEFPSDLSGKQETEHKGFILINKITVQTVDLFNLKTNAMRKLSILTIIFGLIGSGLFTLSNKSFAQADLKFTDFGVMDSISAISKKEAIKEIDEIKRKATFHNESIDIIKTYAEKSSYNFDTYVLLSKLIGSFGHSTKPVMEIANIAFLTYKDCDLFNEIAPLIFLNNHNTDIYVKLAKDASEARSDADKDKIREQIIKYKEQSEFKTLLDAFNSQKKI
jgi:transcriptional regulator with XRE-family HTH domain